MADEGESTFWQIENIPSEDAIFMRAHKQYFNDDGTLQPGVFRDQKGGMSTDWSKYSTPEETRTRARVPADNAVLRLIVGDVRGIQGQAVVHEPEFPNNRSHTNVVGEKDTETRIMLLRMVSIVLERVRD